jgi:hypothetical protein
MKTSEVLNKAADLIERDGWTRWGDGWHGEGGYCVEGALCKVLGIGIEVVGGPPEEEFDSAPAAIALAAYVDELPGETFQWNDRQPGPAPVIEALRACAVIEAAREDAAVRESVPA